MTPGEPPKLPVVFTPAARVQLRALPQATALRILKALARFAASGEGDVQRLEGIALQSGVKKRPRARGPTSANCVVAIGQGRRAAKIACDAVRTTRKTTRVSAPVRVRRARSACRVRAGCAAEKKRSPMRTAIAIIATCATAKV
jgi:hypothetical protein